MNDIVMYTSEHCPYCKQADALFKRKGVASVRKISIDSDTAKRDAMIARTNRRTVPQIFIGNTHVGGFDDLAKLDRAGGLDDLLHGKVAGRA